MKRFTIVAAVVAMLIVNHVTEAGIVDVSGYNNVYYVSTTGNDLDTGDSANPFATVAHAIDAAASSGDAIFVTSGQYDVTHTGVFSTIGYDSGLNNKGKDVDFIGIPNETTFLIDGTATTSRDLHFYSGKGFSRVYDITFIRDSNGRSTNYNNAFFGSNGPVQGEFYNTVFKSINSPVIGLTYDNSNTLDVKVYNSVFDVETNFGFSYSGRNVEIVNSASNKAFNLSDGTNSFTSVLSNASFDADYIILSDPNAWQDVGVGLDLNGSVADLGVYGSTYSWSAVPEPSSFALLAFAGLLSARFRCGEYQRCKRMRRA